MDFIVWQYTSGCPTSSSSINHTDHMADDILVGEKQKNMSGPAFK